MPDVRDHGQVVELIVAGEFRRFPDLSFGHLAVAEQDVNARVAFIHACADCEAGANGKSLAERAGGRIDTACAADGLRARPDSAAASSRARRENTPKLGSKE